MQVIEEGGYLFMDLVTGLPILFDIAIINYTETKVYCKGTFKRPTREQAEKYSKEPIAFFEPAEKGYWGVAFYSLDEVKLCIEREAVAESWDCPTSKMYGSMGLRSIPT